MGEPRVRIGVMARVPVKQGHDVVPTVDFRNRPRAVAETCLLVHVEVGVDEEGLCRAGR
jgi:hypothetical protein